MIERRTDLEVHGVAAQLHKSQLDSGLLDRDYAHHRARWTQSRNLDAKQSYKCGDTLDEQLKTVSAQ